MIPGLRPRTRAERQSAATRRFVATAVAMVLLLLVGLAALLAAVVVQVTPERREAVPLAVGDVYTVPPRVPLVGDVVVYGSPPDGERPDLAELGCQVTDGGGPLSTEQAQAEDRIVVGDQGLVPLVSFPGHPGHSLACAGPAAEAASPLYVIPGSSSRDLVPLAGFSLAALCIPLAVVGMLHARWSRV